MYTERLARNAFGYSDDLHRLHMQENARQTSCLLLSNFLEVRQICRNSILMAARAFDDCLDTAVTASKNLTHRTIKICTRPLEGVIHGYHTVETMGRRVSIVVTPVLSRVATALNTVNPVAICIRKGPKAISIPLQVICEEAQALKQFISHPLDSLLHSLEFVGKKPKRAVNILQAMGVPVDSTTITLLNCEDHLNDLNTKFTNMLKNGVSPVKEYSSDMDKIRGRLLIATTKALFNDWSELSSVTQKYTTKLAMKSLQRAGAKCVQAATDYGTEQLASHLDSSSF